MMNDRYPNLELIEYIAKQELWADKKCKAILKKANEGKRYTPLDFDMIVFSQIWGSTCTGFDVTESGEPVIAGQAFTKKYTTVVHEHVTDMYLVFFGNDPCYKVGNPTDVFMQDLAARQMKSLREAKKLY